MESVKGSKSVDHNSTNDDGRSLLLPLADAPSIVQAHQKDNQIEAAISVKLEKFLKDVKGQLFTNTHIEGISVAVKLLYLGFTTIAGNKTLGEEYVDLIYVNRKGSQLIKRYKKILFVLSYALGPLAVSRILKRWNSSNNENDKVNQRFSYKKMVDVLLNLHLVIFYFKGAYYDVFKRALGMRYAIGHKVNTNEAKFRKRSSDTYKLLGYILLLQVTSKRIPAIMRYAKESFKSSNRQIDKNGAQYNEKSEVPDYSIRGVPDESKLAHIDLSDELQFQFIPSTSRTCILCLNLMLDPSCAPCGHLFCWNCITCWCKERPQCPLCRQKSLPQQILSLR